MNIDKLGKFIDKQGVSFICSVDDEGFPKRIQLVQFLHKLPIMGNV